MAFTLPVFNLTCNIYTGPWLTKAFRLSSPCNLARGRRVAQSEGPVLGGSDLENMSMTVLLPPLTDIRDITIAGPGDVVEVPAGSGRWYGVVIVDDVGKGFANEHRFACIAKLSEIFGPAYAGADWPRPIP